MKCTTHQLTESELNQVYAKMRKDIRVKELYKTAKERPLTALERLIFNQLFTEFAKGVSEN